MTGTEVERRLAAVLAADVAGYTRLMAAREAETLQALRDVQKSIFDPVVSRHHGTTIKRMGDSWLIEFISAVDAVNCAITLQEKLMEHEFIKIRVGVHVGDIMHADSDIFGDGVNIASRLESISEPGGIVVSDTIYSFLDGTLRPAFHDGGERQLKNVVDPVRVWVRGSSLRRGIELSGRSGSEHSALVIAPFATSDTRAEVRELATALTRDVVAMLDTLEWLRVQISEETLTRASMLRSTIRASGDRIRFEAVLSRADGSRIWADRYDGRLGEVFDWQDSTAEKLSSAVRTHLLEEEIRPLKELEPESMTASQCLLLGTYHQATLTVEDARRALEFFKLAMAKDPSLGLAFGRAAGVLNRAKVNGWTRFFSDEMPKRDEWLATAQSLSPDSGEIAVLTGLIQLREGEPLSVVRGDFERALWLEPNSAWILTWVGWGHVYCGEPQQALVYLRKAARLSPFDRGRIFAEAGLALASLHLGFDQECVEHAQKSVALGPGFPSPWRSMLSALGHLGDSDAIEMVRARLIALVPNETISEIKSRNGYLDDVYTNRFLDGLRLAGLPE